MVAQLLLTASIGIPLPSLGTSNPALERYSLQTTKPMRPLPFTEPHDVPPPPYPGKEVEEEGPSIYFKVAGYLGFTAAGFHVVSQEYRKDRDPDYDPRFSPTGLSLAINAGIATGVGWLTGRMWGNGETTQAWIGRIILVLVYAAFGADNYYQGFFQGT